MSVGQIKKKEREKRRKRYNTPLKYSNAKSRKSINGNDINSCRLLAALINCGIFFVEKNKNSPCETIGNVENKIPADTQLRFG